MTRLAVARLWFCSNSFTPRRTRADLVHRYEWNAGADAIAGPLAPAGAADGELFGVRRFLATRPGWEASLLRCASAPPGGPLSADLFGSWMAEVEDDLRRGQFDAVYLSLHGACQAEGDPAADLTILRRMRAVVGRTPIVASFDMRANLSEETAILLDGASANRVWPQGGGADAAGRALDILEGIIAGRHRPVGALARVPTLLPDSLIAPALGEVWRGSLARLPAGVLDASVFSGFAWGDSPYAGPSALVWADRDAGLARETAAHLAMELSRWRGRVAAGMVSAQEALVAARAMAADPRPVLLLDPSDDVAAGGLADTPGLLRAMIAGDCAGLLPGRALVAALCDPEVVADAWALGPEAPLACTLGARSTAIYGAGQPVEGRVQVLFETEDAGRAAVIRTGQVDVVVTSLRTADLSLAALAAVGIDPQAYRLLAIKGAAAVEAGYAGRVSVVMRCDCPGPASPDLLRLPFHYVPAVRRATGPTARAADDAGDGVGAGQPGASAFASAARSVAPNLAMKAIARTGRRSQGGGEGGPREADPRHEERRASASGALRG